MVLARPRVDRPPELCGRGAALVAVGMRDIFRDKPGGGGVMCGSWVITKRVTKRAGGTVRRAWYHGARCRQRARRARLAAVPQRAALLDTIARAEHALAALRRDLLAGGAAD